MSRIVRFHFAFIAIQVLFFFLPVISGFYIHYKLNRGRLSNNGGFQTMMWQNWENLKGSTKMKPLKPASRPWGNNYMSSLEYSNNLSQLVIGENDMNQSDRIDGNEMNQSEVTDLGNKISQSDQMELGNGIPQSDLMELEQEIGLIEALGRDIDEQSDLLDRLWSKVGALEEVIALLAKNVDQVVDERVALKEELSDIQMQIRNLLTENEYLP